jgi:tripartite-type tricarboxylate transporter receptor subunit TctC
MPYRLDDFAPVTLATLSPFVLVVHPSLPVSSVKELIALARAKPGALNYGSAGNGAVSHLATEQFKWLAGVQLTHVPYKGSAQALTDLVGGQLQLMIENQPVVLPQIRAGRLRALAVGTAKRSALLPDIPTMAEAGVAGYHASTGFGVLAPAKTAHEIVMQLNREIVKILQAAEVRERLATQGLDAIGSTPQQYGEHLRAELAQNAKVIKAAGIKIE